MRRRLDRLAPFGIVVSALAGSFAVAALVDEPVGPLFLVPALAAGWWFGPRGGLIAGAVATGLFVLARVVDPDNEVPPATSIGLRLAVFSGAGYAFGQLITQRGQLRARVQRQRAELAELRILRDMLTPPALPDRPGIELATCFVPAEHGVAGDFYLVAEGPGGATVIAVGDVSGKGPAAARRAAYARTALATFASLEGDPARLLDMANHALIERLGDADDFVTAACVVLDADGTLTWSLAGHPPPLWLDTAEPLEGPRPGMPLGIAPAIGVSAGSAAVAPGRGLVIFSDGLLEARGPSGELLGADAVRRIVARLPGASPARVVDELRAAAESFASGRLADDLSVLAVRVTARSPDQQRTPHRTVHTQ